ncbi:MAG TPA: tRNA epoxyqueuosine(34) reductase QueG [Terracidiphilus sp.]|nr:tRNA epoxyqueuosine(34) reductase QueG [Terracidiphilus sp.]
MDDKSGTGGGETITGLTLEDVRAKAIEIGFSEAGLVALPHQEEARNASRFEAWIEAGHAGSMAWLKRTDEAKQFVRARVSTPFPWARSAIVCFANYNSSSPRSTDAAPRHSGWIARYAWSSRRDPDGTRRPSDYHKVLLKHLRALESRLHESFGAFESRAYVDTGPVVERSLATAAGLGWTGKNTCLIHPKLGSFGFLGVLLTSLEVSSKAEAVQVRDHCGSCTRCIEACPTEALIAPYTMDATRCIAYLTIEHKGTIAPELMEGTGRQIFGCDICQDVCPWNRKAPMGTDKELEPRAELVNPALEVLAAMDEQAFERTFNGSPVRRAGFTAFRRNVAVAAGNTEARALAPQLRDWSSAADEGLRAAAAWALEKLKL